MTVTQKGPVIKYIAKFQGIAARLEQLEDAQIAQYRRGLKEDIKDKLADQEDIKDLGTLIIAAHAIDNYLYKRR